MSGEWCLARLRLSSIPSSSCSEDIRWSEKVSKDRKPHNPLPPGEGEISLPHSRAIFSKLKNEDKDLFSFRNCKKWCKKSTKCNYFLFVSILRELAATWNRQCIGERAGREVAKRGFGSPQAVVYEWIRLSIVLPYADHLFSMTQTLLPRFCSNEAQEW